MTNTVPMAPTILVVLGATGDLVRRKIAPALFHLFEKDELPAMFATVGFSRQEMTNESFREHIDEILEQHQDISVTKRLRQSFLETLTYQSGDFTDASAYEQLGKMLEAIDEDWGVCSNKLFYLAVPPALYEQILRHLAASGLTEPCGGDDGWTRVIVEKPFGNDLKTAEALDALLGSLFVEEQIYRIDHYLGKEMLRNILAFRFANSLFEASWNAERIARIELSLLETIDVGSRGEFYDSVGALRDVGQNHLLQMLALLTMEHPGELEDTLVRKKRREVLDALRVNPIKTFRAQYKSYKGTLGVPAESETETYFAIKCTLNTARWKNVPIYLEGGKALGSVKKALTVTMKHPKVCLCTGDEHLENQVVFTLEPEEGIRIRFFAKKPGLSAELEEREFRFYYQEQQAQSYNSGRPLAETKSRNSQTGQAEAYEKLLLDCILGDQLLFVSTQEVAAMWRFIDPIIQSWQNGEVPLSVYQKGSDDIRDIARDAIE